MHHVFSAECQSKIKKTREIEEKNRLFVEKKKSHYLFHIHDTYFYDFFFFGGVNSLKGIV